MEQFLCLYQFGELTVERTLKMIPIMPTEVIDSYYRWASPPKVKQNLWDFASSPLSCEFIPSLLCRKWLLSLCHPLLKWLGIYMQIHKDGPLVSWVLGFFRSTTTPRWLSSSLYASPLAMPSSFSLGCLPGTTNNSLMIIILEGWWCFIVMGICHLSLAMSAISYYRGWGNAQDI